MIDKKTNREFFRKKAKKVAKYYQHLYPNWL